MPPIGVLTRGKYGRQLLETLAAHTEPKITSTDMLTTLPTSWTSPPFVDNLDMDTVKMYVIAPGDKRQSVDYVDCYARVVLINRDWYVDEKVKVIYEWITV